MAEIEPLHIDDLSIEDVFKAFIWDVVNADADTVLLDLGWPDRAAVARNMKLPFVSQMPAAMRRHINAVLAGTRPGPREVRYGATVADS